MPEGGRVRVAVAVLTYNRRDLLQRTLASMAPVKPIVVDNGSTDGTAKLVRKMGGICLTGGDHGIAQGFRAAVEAALKQKPELVVFSGDDFEYEPGWLERLTAFWEGAPANVMMCGMYLEREFPNMPVLGTVEYGGQRALVRPLLPGASLSFRASLWREIEPLMPKRGNQYDRQITRGLAKGRLLCALPLSRHIGTERRVPRPDLGNKPFPEGPEVDRAQWGV